MTSSAAFSPITRAVRASIATDSEHGAVVPPIHLSSTFAFEGFGRPRTYDYTRSGNPTRSQLADALAQLEGGAGAVVTSTGMSAVTAVLALVRAGETVVAAHDCYGGTQRLLRALAARGHFEVVFTDLTAPDADLTIGRHAPRVVWIETPSNPLLRITDIRRLSAAAQAAGALAVVDNTFLSPALQQPLALGADVVVHSTTKYLNGHSDVVGGAVIARDEAVAAELGWWANCLGITGAPFDSYLTLRGVRTLHTRIRQHLENTAAVVEALGRHEAVTRLFYPGLATHPGHALAAAQQSGFGAMLSFEVRGGTDAVELLASRLRCFTLAESLGGVESLIAHPATMTHASMDAAARERAGISESLVRLSVGIEDPHDLVYDLTGALDEVAARFPEARAAQRHRSPVRRTAPQTTPVDVVLLGAGAIGRELLAQIRDLEPGAPVRVCAVIDRSGAVVEPEGLAPHRLEYLAGLKAAGRTIIEADGARPGSVAEVLEAIADAGLARPVLVDATAMDSAVVVEGALRSGWDVVLANKVPLAGDQATADRLLGAACDAGRRLEYEATVGAGLPVIDTLRKLMEAGDRVLSIEGCPSGTLGFLFAELGQGRSFSSALRRAIDAGYTEPDPRIDLSGIDVARKALILARAIGFRGDLHDVRVESLVPPALAGVSREAFIAGAADCDAAFAARVRDAARLDQVLRYRARVTPTDITVGLVAVSRTDPLAGLAGTDNQFAFTTTRYRKQPLVITGPGAGAAVTAAGMLNDLFRIAAAHSALRSGARTLGAFGPAAVPEPVSLSA